MSGTLPPVPTEDELYERIAAIVEGTDAGRVRDVLTAHGVDLSSPLPVRRELVVHRLYCAGTKTGTEDNDGPFEVDMVLGPGPWAIASTKNSAGKSSLLWALSVALRGEGFDEFRRAETVPWFSYVRADIVVAGVAASVRLTFREPNRPSARLLTADTIDQLLELNGRDETGPHIRVAASADSPGVEDLIGRFMQERLGLRPVSVWAAEAGAKKDTDGHKDSREQIHGWASFFYAIGLNSASDKILMGPTAIGQLQVKLMQIFLDVPYAAELTHLTSARSKDLQEVRRVARRAREDDEARSLKAEPIRAALADARSRVAVLEAKQPDLTGLLAALDAAARRVARDQEAHRDAVGHREAARKDRLRDERAVRRAHQSDAARLLLGALDPETCPRCDSSIDDDRREAEHTDHRCAVCARSLPDATEDPEARALALRRLDDRVAASRSREDSARDAEQAAAETLAASRAEHTRSDAALAAARSEQWYADLEGARREVYQLEGALAVATNATSQANGLPAVISGYGEVDGQAPNDLDELTESMILNMAVDALKVVVERHSKALFADINTEIVRIAKSLGVTNLTSVNLDLAGRVNARKSGVAVKFKDLSPTERLRMRIAAVVAMITVGRRHGIMSHPGLLLIDAPTAEEMEPQTTYLALKTLHDTAEAVPGMQIVITSIEEAVWEIFPEDRIVSGSDRRRLF
ncbi:hypothetical protein ACG83_39455 [Frankia sp. R43]|uniref:hypothetical protein n=1 Tax=Frankia sp. R43 TaxID=269536 RepID=UPI0006CA48DE|nr:hypothetical protein [Frankia sp. R43]KPM50617.1 hypothetical protein ACG83_39455 [Frankia sp. R43]